MRTFCGNRFCTGVLNYEARPSRNCPCAGCPHLLLKRMGGSCCLACGMVLTSSSTHRCGSKQITSRAAVLADRSVQSMFVCNCRSFGLGVACEHEQAARAVDERSVDLGPIAQRRAAAEAVASPAWCQRRGSTWDERVSKLAQAACGAAARRRAKAKPKGHGWWQRSWPRIGRGPCR